ncbi:hypothetical protein MPSEU_000149600 [Mayamaea pseudoterrestris]|nr:hypothetical protein MPSEU_000149600 [Mayamaea pseudoterrestris]
MTTMLRSRRCIYGWLMTSSCLSLVFSLVEANKNLLSFSTLPLTAFFTHQQEHQQHQSAAATSSFLNSISNHDSETEFQFGKQDNDESLDQGENEEINRQKYRDADDNYMTESTFSLQEQLQRTMIISPSLLACDWSCVRDEVQRCTRAGATRLHIDVFDGILIDSPQALTFGPQMVQAIRKSCQDQTGDAVLDVHMCVHRPARYVSAMAQAGASRFIFSWESVGSLDEAIDLAFEVASTGMSCGVSINPSTNFEEIVPLLETNMLDCVNVLAVEPGFGGQKFQLRALETVARLRAFRNLSSIDFEIMVDGGINHETAGEAAYAGADILVSGSFMFGHPGGIYLCMVDLLGETQRYTQQ